MDIKEEVIITQAQIRAYEAQIKLLKRKLEQLKKDCPHTSSFIDMNFDGHTTRTWHICTECGAYTHARMNGCNIVKR